MHFRQPEVPKKLKNELDSLMISQKMNISSSTGRRKMYDPSKEAQGPSLGGCLNIYVPLKPPEVP